MEHLASQIRELQNLKIQKIKALMIPKIGCEISRWPIFSIKHQFSKNLVCINSSNWEFSIFMIKEREKDHEKLYQEFSEVEKKQHSIFMKVKSILENEHPMINKVLGIELTSVLICELGSIKRLTEIPWSNLKGIGYMKNYFYNQEPYVSFHPDLINVNILERPKKLREICRRISKAAKFEYFATHTVQRDDLETILSPKSNNRKKQPPKRKTSPAKKKNTGRGGWTKRKKKRLHVYNKEEVLEKAKSPDGFYVQQSSTGDSNISTE